MASPFQFFRKHTAIMMVVLIGLSMASFIVLEPLMQLAQNPGQLTQLSLFLLPLLGAILAWTIKAGSSRSTEYALWGAVGGLVVAAGWRISSVETSYAVLIGGLGVVAFGFWNIAASQDSTGADRSLETRLGDQTAIAWWPGKSFSMNGAVSAVITGLLMGGIFGIFGRAIGSPAAPATIDDQPISFVQLQQLQQRRQLAERFLVSLVSAVDPQSAQQMQGHFTIGRRFGQSLTFEQDVVMGELFRREADRMGIEIDDDAVTAYIERFTAGRRAKIPILDRALRLNMTATKNREMFKNMAGQLSPKAQEQLFNPRTRPRTKGDPGFSAVSP